MGSKALLHHGQRGKVKKGVVGGQRLGFCKKKKEEAKECAEKLFSLSFQSPPVP